LKVTQVIAGERLVVIELAIFAFGRRPGFPSIVFIENIAVSLALDLGLHHAILFQPIEIFQEQQPRRLLGITEFRRAAGFLVQDIVNISRGWFKHAYLLVIK
jgi:hypothetical protein